MTKEKNQKPKKEATKETKAKEYLGDQASMRECPKCHMTYPLTTQYWWIFKDLRKGSKIEDNLYYPNCRECYKKYRKMLVRVAKRKTKSQEKVASQEPKESNSKQVLESNILPRKTCLDINSPFFLIDLKDQVTQVLPTKISNRRTPTYIVKRGFINGAK
jgi:protein-arginine kinase activator protein McsA